MKFMKQVCRVWLSLVKAFSFFGSLKKWISFRGAAQETVRNEKENLIYIRWKWLALPKSHFYGPVEAWAPHGIVWFSKLYFVSWKNVDESVSLEKGNGCHEIQYHMYFTFLQRCLNIRYRFFVSMRFDTLW